MFTLRSVLVSFLIFATTLWISSCSDNANQGNTQIEGPDIEVIEDSDEDFYWLDDISSPEALAWVAGENAKTLNILEADPRFSEYQQTAENILSHPDKLPTGPLMDGYLYDNRQDRQNPLGLWRRTSFADYKAGNPNWQSLLDLDALSIAENKRWIFKGAQCLFPDTTRCMVELADRGMDTATYREFDMETRSFVENGFIVPEAKSRIWWQDENTLLVATDWGPETLNQSGFPRQIRRWHRGTSLDKTELVFEGEYHEFLAAATFVNALGPGSFVAMHGEGFLFLEYLAIPAEGEPYPLPIPKEAEIRGVHNGNLLLLLRSDWQPDGEVDDTIFPVGTLVSVALSPLLQEAKIENPRLIFTPDKNSAIQEVVSVNNKIYLNIFRDIVSEIIEVSMDDETIILKTIPFDLDRYTTIEGIDGETGQLLLNSESPLTPDRLLLVDPVTADITELAVMPTLFDTTNLITERLSVASSDGQMIPYTVMRASDVELNGLNPTLVYGYGGFRTAVTPRYEPLFGKLWLEKGGIYVHANIRGGSEFGPAWHKAPMLTNRQLAYDDYQAILEDIIARGYSSAQHLGIIGRSNGGLLMGVTMTQRPDLINAVVIGGPLIDMLRFDKLGPGQSWTFEYGDPDIPEMRSYIETYSPYQNLKRNTPYPVPLIITSTWDDRVYPGHARRFAAKLRLYGNDVFYFEDDHGGHYWELAGGLTPGDWRTRSKARAIEFIYLARQLGNDIN